VIDASIEFITSACIAGLSALAAAATILHFLGSWMEKRSLRENEERELRKRSAQVDAEVLELKRAAEQGIRQVRGISGATCSYKDQCALLGVKDALPPPFPFSIFLPVADHCCASLAIYAEKITTRSVADWDVSIEWKHIMSAQTRLRTCIVAGPASAETDRLAAAEHALEDIIKAAIRIHLHMENRKDRRKMAA
jgi:hypothetical protein